MPKLVSLTHLSLQILGKDGSVSDFQTSSQPSSRIKVNCDKSRTSDGDGIDMKHEPVTKLDDHVMSTNCDPVAGFRRIDCKTYILINRNFLSYKK